MTNSGAPADATSCTGGTVTAAANGPSVALAGGTIPANSFCTVTVQVTATATATDTLAIGSVTTTNRSSNAAAASATLTVTAAIQPPTVSKAFNPTTITTGG